MNVPPTLGAIIGIWRKAGKQFWLTVTGDSMWPYVRDGDMVLVSHDGSQIQPGDIIVLWQAGRLLIHRTIFVLGDKGHPTFFTKGDNAPHFDPPASAEEIIGRVLMLKRAEQLVSLHTTRWRTMGWLISTTTLVDAWLATHGSTLKQRFLGPQPNRLTSLLRQILSLPFRGILKVLAGFGRRNA